MQLIHNCKLRKLESEWAFVAKDSMEKNIKAIIGLGNPGAKYQNTRHNIGFKVLDALAEQQGATWQEKPLMLIAQVQLYNQTVLLIKPQTFMNSSGQVIPLLQKKGIEAENILVVHDELEKPFGTVAVRQGGSHRGHNGLRSIIGSCGPDFWRIRVGIGRPDDAKEVPDYVLSLFKEPASLVDQMIVSAVDLIKAQ